MGSYDYGWWPLVALHVGLVLAFVLGYLRPARREERELGKRFGDEYAAYRTRTPMLLPRLTTVGSGTASGSSDGPGSGGRREA